MISRLDLFPTANPAKLRNTAAEFCMTFEWDENQREIIFHESDEALLVDAGPGAGKTAVACKRIAALIEDHGKDAHNILVISFTRAAIGEFKERIQLFAKSESLDLQGLQIYTLDSLAYRVMKGTDEFDSETSDFDFDANIEAFVRILKDPNPLLIEFLERIQHVMIDEAQDFVGVRAHAVQAFLNEMNPDTGITIFADPAQAIYGFTTDDDNVFEERATLLEKIERDFGEYFQHRNLKEIYRTSDPNLRKIYQTARQSLLKRESATKKEYEELRVLIQKSAHSAIPSIDKQMLTQESTETLVLYRTRTQVLMAASFLWEQGVPSKMRMGNLTPRVHPWIARVLGEFEEDDIGEEEFGNLHASRISQPDHDFSAEQAWRALSKAVGRSQGRISMARLRSAINRSRPPDSLLVDYGSLPGPTLGTIHGSKGRESDLVHLMLPSDYRLEKTDGRGILEEMRILFVGASRAREFLGVGKGYSINSKRLHGSGRAYKTRRDSYQVEFGLAGDVKLESLVANNFIYDQISKMQNDLWEHRNKFFKVFATYDANRKKTLLRRADKDMLLGELSQRAVDDLWQLARLQSDKAGRQLRPPQRIQNLWMAGATTVVIPEHARDSTLSPWNNSGLALAPVLSGFPITYFR